MNHMRDTASKAWLRHHANHDDLVLLAVLVIALLAWYFGG